MTDDLDPLDYSGNVHHWAGRYLRAGLARGLDRDDLAQHGYIGVVKAWRTHRKNGSPDRTFPGYVGPSIRSAMGRAVNTPDAATASRTGPIADDLDRARADSDEGEDAAASLLAVLTDRQALAVELYLGLDGTPGRTCTEVADLMGLASHGNATRLIEAGLANLRRHHNPTQPDKEG